MERDHDNDCSRCFDPGLTSPLPSYHTNLLLITLTDPSTTLLWAGVRWSSAQTVSVPQVVEETGRHKGQEEQAGVHEVHGVSPPWEGRPDRHRGTAAQPVSLTLWWSPSAVFRVALTLKTCFSIYILSFIMFILTWWKHHILNIQPVCFISKLWG